MELFFPLIGVAAVGIAAVAATCCILFPKPKHLVSRVFFGTFAFIFGGTVLATGGTALIDIVLGTPFPNQQLSIAGFSILGAVLFIAFGALSSWLTLKSSEFFLESISSGRNTNQE